MQKLLFMFVLLILPRKQNRWVILRGNIKRRLCIHF